MSEEKSDPAHKLKWGRKPPKGKPKKSYAKNLSHTCSEITMRPIGVVHSSYQERFAVPRQPSLDEPLPAIIELHSGTNLDQALKDLDGFSHIWVLYWMHLNQGWNPTVIPPRGPKKRRGLFATRAPHRPNSIGLSAVRLIKVEEHTLHIQGHDMLDGTPVLDIKPYLPYADSFPQAECGWVGEAGVTDMKVSINTGS